LICSRYCKRLIFFPSRQVIPALPSLEALLAKNTRKRKIWTTGILIGKRWLLKDDFLLQEASGRKSNYSVAVGLRFRWRETCSKKIAKATQVKENDDCRGRTYSASFVRDSILDRTHLVALKLLYGLELLYPVAVRIWIIPRGRRDGLESGSWLRWAMTRLC